jgi:hypothetical protein
MAECEECRDRAASRRDVAGRIESLRPVTTAHPLPWTWAAAAGLALAVGGTGAWMLLRGPAPTGRPPVTRIAPLFSIRDASGPISIDTTGAVHGVQAGEQGLAAQLLTTGRIARPKVLDLVTTDPDVLRGETRPHELHVESPVGVVLLDDRPQFRWRGADGSRFEVTVLDEDLTPVAHSPSLRTRQWIPPAPLPRGRTLLWQVASEGRETAVDPAPPNRPARFRIVDNESRARIDAARATGSHLLLAHAYAEAGMRAEAERELRELSAMNPDSPVAKRLLESVRSWTR